MTDIFNNAKILQDEPLKNHTTFKIGGPAKYFAELTATDDLIELLKTAASKKIPYVFIGGGSNLLVADKGFDGLVIKIKPHQLKIIGNEAEVDAGYPLAGLITACLKKGLTGLEFAAGVPGTTGGAIKGNAGTYGEAMDKVVKTVTYLDENFKISSISAKNCHFNYRHSIFKEKENWLIISAILSLKTGDAETSKKLIEERIQKRAVTQPSGYPSAGCVFKNIIFTEEIADKLKSLGWNFPDQFKIYKKIPASYVIENLDLKNKIIGQAQISEKHANYIINLGNATASEVIQLISFVKQQVRDKTGIQLQEEVRYLGFN